MVKKTMYQKICTLKRQGLGKSEIASRLTLNIKTVNKYYNMAENKFREYQKSLLIKEKIFNRFEEDILEGRKPLPRLKPKHTGGGIGNGSGNNNGCGNHMTLNIGGGGNRNEGDRSCRTCHKKVHPGFGKGSK